MRDSGSQDEFVPSELTSIARFPPEVIPLAVPGVMICASGNSSVVECDDPNRERKNDVRVIDFKKKTGSAKKLTVGPDGLEPSTHGLKVRCSTN